MQRTPCCGFHFLLSPLFAGLGATRAQTGTKADVVATITNLENDGVKSRFAGDTSFTRSSGAEDWTRGDSDGTFYTKAEVMKTYARRQRTSDKQRENFLNSRCECTGQYGGWRSTRTPMTFSSRGTSLAHLIATDTFVQDGRRMEAGRETRASVAKLPLTLTHGGDR